MQKKLQAKLLWLLIPPVVALLVFLGPLGGADRAIAPDPAGEAGTRLQVPPTPDLWQVGSALLGVLLIGAVVVMVLARLRGAAPLARSGEAGEVLALRQTLRISGRQRLHAVEFDGRVLLLGEHENNLTLLTSTGDPGAREDERAIAMRRDEVDGVDLLDTPRDDVAGRHEPDYLVPRAAPAKPELTPANLSDFKSLMRRARSKAQV